MYDKLGSMWDVSAVAYFKELSLHMKQEKHLKPSQNIQLPANEQESGVWHSIWYRG